MVEYHVGFTGTRKGMSPEQHRAVRKALQDIRAKNFHADMWAHHGECVGSDEQFHRVALEEGFQVHVHPPKSNKWRAFTVDFSRMDLPDDYQKRDKAIVAESHEIIATPRGSEESYPYSGTWLTIRIARRMKVPYVIFMPDGGRLDDQA
jgi:hypothetical protein